MDTRFGIASIETHETPTLEPRREDDEAEPEYESTVLLRRFAGVRFPIDVRVRFEDGSVRDFTKLDLRLACLSEFENLRRRRRVNLKRGAHIAGGVIGGAAVLILLSLVPDELTGPSS